MKNVTDVTFGILLNIAYRMAKTTNINKAGQTHDQLQAACWEWACNAYHPHIYGKLIAIPNDMHAGNVVRWKQYEAIGVTPGVWDMQLNWFAKVQTIDYGLLIVPAVYWWEFKVGADKLSTTRIVNGKKKRGQIEHREALLPFGHKFYVAHEEEEFQQQFKLIVEPTLDYINGANKSNIKVIQ